MTNTETVIICSIEMVVTFSVSENSPITTVNLTIDCGSTLLPKPYFNNDENESLFLLL